MDVFYQPYQKFSIFHAAYHRFCAPFKSCFSQNNNVNTYVFHINKKKLHKHISYNQIKLTKKTKSAEMSENQNINNINITFEWSVAS